MQSEPLNTGTAVSLPAMRSGEQIVWTGRPATMWTFQLSDKWSLLGGISWTIGVPAIWLPMFGGSIPVPLLVPWVIGIPFCFYGHVARRMSWRKVRYVLTTQRAFMLEESTRRPIRQVELDDCRVELRGLRPDGIGTVFFFAPDPPPNARMYRWSGYTDYRYRFDFVAIPDAQRVCQVAQRPVATTDSGPMVG